MKYGTRSWSASFLDDHEASAEGTRSTFACSGGPSYDLAPWAFKVRAPHGFQRHGLDG